MKIQFLLRLFLSVAVHSSIVMAQQPGTFTPTADMNSRRFSHTAALLTDGRVLIAGGTMIEGMGPNIGLGISLKTLGSAELYDAVTGTFTLTGNMTMPRGGHTATVLPDGKVLIAGGGPWGPTDGVAYSSASAEIYDPSAETFTATADMTEARTFHTATLLNSGLVLIAGGLQRPVGSPASAFRILASAELYDPATRVFTPTGAMTKESADTATLLPNGKVLVTRGFGTNLYADVYDPSTGTFVSEAGLGYHAGPTATLLLNGKVLVAGGDVGDGDGPSVVAELFDPTSATFSTSGRLFTGREQHSATLLPDGTVLLTGGHIVPDIALTAEIYDPVKGTSSLTGPLPGDRELHTATLLNDGRVLIAGGDDERYWIPETILSSTELYTPQVLVRPPVLLSLSGDGRGQGAIQHADTYQIASADNPAAPEEILVVYCTGLVDGSVIPPQVAIGGRLAEILFFGNTPGYAGLDQINVRVPIGVAPGPSVPVRLNYLNRPSNEVTIGVR